MAEFIQIPKALRCHRNGQCHRQNQRIGARPPPRSLIIWVSRYLQKVHCMASTERTVNEKESPRLQCGEQRKMCAHQRVSEGSVGMARRWVEGLRWAEEVSQRVLYLSKAHRGWWKSAGSASSGRAWHKDRSACAKVLRQTGPARSRNSKELFVFEVKVVRKRNNPSSINGSVLLRAWHCPWNFKNLQGAYNPMGKLFKIETVHCTVGGS